MQRACRNVRHKIEIIKIKIAFNMQTVSKKIEIVGL